MFNFLSCRLSLIEVKELSCHSDSGVPVACASLYAIPIRPISMGHQYLHGIKMLMQPSCFHQAKLFRFFWSHVSQRLALASTPPLYGAVVFLRHGGWY